MRRVAAARRTLPLRGYALDLLVWVGSVVLLAAFAVVGYSLRAGDRGGAGVAPEEHLALALVFHDCAGFDPEALLRELERYGSVRSYPSPDGPAASGPPDPPVRVWPPQERPARGDAPARRVQGAVASVLITPRSGERAVLDVAGLAAAAGCYPDQMISGPWWHQDASSGARSGRSPRLLLAVLLSTLLGGVLAYVLRRRSLSGRLPTQPLPRALGLGALAGVGIQLGAMLAMAGLLALGLRLQPTNAALFETLLHSYPVMTLLAVVLLAPLAEELAFRHLMLRRFALAGHARIGLLLSSGVFALGHEAFSPVHGLQSLLAGLLYLALGVGFGLVYLRTGRLSAAVLAHALANAIATTLALAGAGA